MVRPVNKVTATRPTMDLLFLKLLFSRSPLTKHLSLSQVLICRPTSSVSLAALRFSTTAENSFISLMMELKYLAEPISQYHKTKLHHYHHNQQKMVSESSSSISSCPIKTVVVLVHENRSFDHMLGWMKSLNPDINGVTESESNLISTSDPNSKRVSFGDNSAYVDPDPGHSIQAVYKQVFGEPWSEASASKKPRPNNGGIRSKRRDNAGRVGRDGDERVQAGGHPSV